MKIVCVGGGPAGLYLAILMKKADPAHRITVVERNQPSDTFGFGVVFSDQTLSYLREADADSHAQITRQFAHWDDIAIHYRGELVTSTGHGFCGLSRQTLLSILQQRCQELGVELRPPRELRGHVGAVLSAMFDRSGERLVTAGADGSARVWSLSAAAPPLSALAAHSSPCAAPCCGAGWPAWRWCS